MIEALQGPAAPMTLGVAACKPRQGYNPEIKKHFLMQKIAVLYDASQTLTTTEPEEVLRRILTIVRDYFQIHTAAVFLLEEETHELVPHCHIGCEEVFGRARIAIGTGLTGIAAKVKRPIFSADVRRDPRCLFPVPGMVSELAIPLMMGDSVVGVLDCQSDKTERFDRETIDLLTLFSTQASMAFQNARLYTLEQKRATELRAINAVAKQATAVLELSELLHSVCEVVQKSFPCDHACVLLKEGDDLVLQAQKGTLTPSLEEGHHIADSPDWWQCPLGSGGIFKENDVRGLSGEARLYRQAQSSFSVPLISHGQPLGLLVLFSQQKDFFARTDRQPLESVADIFSSAIQNANYVERVKQLAFLDGLTGIFNRRYLETRLTEEIERSKRYDTILSVVMVDVDRFKLLNDEFGHLLGDEVLRQVSSLLSERLRKSDVVCRYGGEEFVALLPQTTTEQALLVAEKLRRAVAEWRFPGVPRPVTISAGVATFPDHATTRDDLLQAADGALYTAKQSGRNRVLVAGKTKTAETGT